MPQPLGRREPTDWKHVEKYPLRSLSAAATPVKVPVTLGVNWYTNFDSPQKVGNTYWIGKGDLGTVRGGHAICAKPQGVSDSTSWWDFYDQGQEGACVGFSSSRMMSLLNRQRYGATWLYGEAQLVDEYSDTPPEEGTSVRAACDILRDRGHRKFYNGTLLPEDQKHGIAANRWATNWDEVRTALGIPDSADGVPLLNSWGRDYPHIVRITDEAGARLLDEDGEAALVTDR